MNERRVAAFAKPADFRGWLAKNHETTRDLLVRCYKVHAAHKGVTYSQALDEALCYGWIDGVRRSVDDDSFSVRFSPRKPKSYWSLININRARALEAEGRMRPSGLAAFRARDPVTPKRYSDERRAAKLNAAFAKKFRANKRAWTFFQSQTPSYQRVTTFWIMSAKQEGTRQSRLDLLIDCAARGTTIPPLRRTPK